MGLRGPRNTPTAILKLRGNLKQSKRRPKPAGAKPPRCPPQLDDAARAVWKRVVKLGVKLGTVTAADVEALARYCRLYVLWQQCAAFVEKHGVSYPITNDAGRPKCFAQFPQVGTLHKLSVELLKLEREFGFTASARAALHVDDPSDEEPAVAARSRTA